MNSGQFETPRSWRPAMCEAREAGRIEWLRAGYGEELIGKLSRDLTARFGRGFGKRNLFQMRAFYLAYVEIVQTASAQLRPSSDDQKVQMVSAISRPATGELAALFRESAMRS